MIQSSETQISYLLIIGHKVSGLTMAPASSCEGQSMCYGVRVKRAFCRDFPVKVSPVKNPLVWPPPKPLNVNISKPDPPDRSILFQDFKSRLALFVPDFFQRIFTQASFKARISILECAFSPRISGVSRGGGLHSSENEGESRERGLLGTTGPCLP